MIKPVLGSQLRFGHPLSKGLVGLWLMNEGSGNIVQDLSGNGNTGTFVNTPTWVAGKYGQAIELSSGTTDRIEVSTSRFNLSAGAIECRFRCGLNYDDGLTHDLFDTSVNNDLLIWKHSNNTTYLYTDGTHRGNAVYPWASGVDYHVVLNWPSNELWINGVLAINGVDAAIATLDPTFIYGNHDSATFAWTGQHHYLRIYNRELNASERAQLYREPFCMFEREPIELLVGSVGAGAPPSGNAGIMTPNTGFWGPTF